SPPARPDRPSPDDAARLGIGILPRHRVYPVTRVSCAAPSPQAALRTVRATYPRDSDTMRQAAWRPRRTTGGLRRAAASDRQFHRSKQMKIMQAGLMLVAVVATTAAAQERSLTTTFEAG